MVLVHCFPALLNICFRFQVCSTSMPYPAVFTRKNVLHSGGRHLRLVWVDSPPAEGWHGWCGVARLRVDTALSPEHPAVMISPGLSLAVRDPVVELQTCAIPPHYMQPWSTVELVGTKRGATRRVSQRYGQLDPGGRDAGESFFASGTGKQCNVT